VGSRQRVRRRSLSASIWSQLADAGRAVSWSLYALFIGEAGMDDMRLP
jgi:hypothetical protein